VVDSTICLTTFPLPPATLLALVGVITLVLVGEALLDLVGVVRVNALSKFVRSIFSLSSSFC